MAARLSASAREVIRLERDRATRARLGRASVDERFIAASCDPHIALVAAVLTRGGGGIAGTKGTSRDHR
jgi:hypothetical protein